MGYKNLRECILDLEQNGHLVRIDEEADARLEVGAIQRRVYQAGGPAVYFSRVKDCRFPLVGNLFGTLERTRFMFRDSLKSIERLVAAKIDPAALLRDPASLAHLPFDLWHLRPRKIRHGPILAHETSISQLPQIQSWPDDGGAFITLPLVYSESLNQPGWRHANLGMYRIQLSGGCYEPDREVGLHYQLHRGIGVHHAEALAKREPLRVNVFVGGPPALTMAAVMPLPEGMPELAFAGLLGGRRLNFVCQSGQLPIPAEVDFCISGTVEPDRTLPEGPFGDHLGYYSLVHDFPVLKVDRVWYRDGAIWPFTTVGRPPQEDSTFGAFIHELTGDLVSDLLPGVRAVHAVDAAGVHPLLLAIGSERYVPYVKERKPQELLTQANAILGQGQLSLAKYLLIVSGEDNSRLDINDIPGFFTHLLKRVDWRCDLHFQTRTTMDTLDYSANGLNQGSKVIIAAAGQSRRQLKHELPSSLSLPPGYYAPRIVMPGIVAIKGPPCLAASVPGQDESMISFCRNDFEPDILAGFPLVVIVDDSEFVSRTLNNFLWVVFTRSDPAADLYGVGSFVEAKHWGCSGPLVIDARQKPHHAPPLINDPEIEKQVDALGAAGQPLHGII